MQITEGKWYSLAEMRGYLTDTGFENIEHQQHGRRPRLPPRPPPVNRMHPNTRAAAFLAVVFFAPTLPADEMKLTYPTTRRAEQVDDVTTA